MEKFRKSYNNIKYVQDFILTRCVYTIQF